jgi:uncharacterized protein YbaA (DUF1428 family)
MAMIDGYVIAVPKARRAAFTRRAREIAAMFTECGASEVIDGWGADLDPGKTTSFPRAVKRAEGEDVVLGWILWPSKRAREAGWKKAMADPRMMPEGPDLFDGRRMIFGGFETIQVTRKGI